MAACNFDSSAPSSPSLSQASSQSKFEWDILESDINHLAIKNYEKTKKPPYKIYGTPKINCTFCNKSHKMKRTYYKCMVQSSSDLFVLECPTKYKIDYCESLDCGSIYLHDEQDNQK